MVNSDPKTAQSGQFLGRALFFFFYLCKTIRVDPITLGANDHHDHLEGSLGYPGPLTLPQNSIESLRGDVRPDLCQSGLFSVPAGMSRNTWIVVEKHIPTRERHESSPVCLQGR
ncbi:hypothetical protein CRG98_042721 [Punica granatum]|uniref:Uncharacterized protein n=1 Tax=Punica granatum TaxID=22663 RepID=A0A2I0HYV1_PUNGR|nr:hypothetical protein CRG98_042721 [Punica granatum]